MLKSVPRAHYAEFRKIMLDRVSALAAQGPFELALSGGVDSTIILFACIELGLKPRCLTFYMDGFESEDLKASRNLAKHFGLELTELAIPSDAKSMFEDVRRVLPHCHRMKKTVIQCMIPWLYLYPAMETGHILIGITADEHYCNSRPTQVQLNAEGEESILPLRKVMNQTPGYSTWNVLNFAAHYGKRNTDVYVDQAVEDFFHRYQAKALDKPFEKHISVMAFEDYFKRGAFLRKRASYQVVSGLRDLHDERLLSDPVINPKGHKAIIALYRDVQRELGLTYA